MTTISHSPGASSGREVTLGQALREIVPGLTRGRCNSVMPLAMTGPFVVFRLITRI